MMPTLRLQIAVGAALAAALLLTGCASEEPEPSPSPTREAVTEERPTPSTSPSPRPPDYYEFSIVCHSPDFASETKFISIEDAWTGTGVGRFGSCEARRLRGSDFSPEQRASLDAAGYEDDNLDLLVAMCADLGHNYDEMTSIAVNQITDLDGIAALCPNRPGLDALFGKAGQARQAEAERAAGTRFGPGVLLVGSQIQPGVYVHEGVVEGCYWERTATDGNTIDNFFTAGAARVEVAIQPGDYSFNSTGCGEWSKIG